MLQGLARWPGVSGLLQFAYTASHGITPGTASMVVVPQSRMPTRTGNLSIEYGGRLVFPDCLLDDIEARVDDAGRTTWKLSILDRRWRWRRAGQISGFYNVRRGESIVSGTERSPRELAALCLYAMGERRYSLAGLPNESRPEVSWDVVNPAEALASICDALGCRIVLDLKSRVRVVRVGVGRRIPRRGLLDATLAVNPPDPPGRLEFIAGRNEYQIDATLEAVGVELNGEIRPIDKLSYIPRVEGRKQWTLSDADHFQDVSDQKLRRLAQKSVWRWYRIKPPVTLPGRRRKATDREQILPLLGQQIDTAIIDGREQRRAPWVYGKHWAGTESHENEVDKVDAAIVKRPLGFYAGNFALDTEAGIVKFSEPVYSLKDDPKAVAGKRIEPADLRLRVGCNFRPSLTTREWERYRRTRRLRTSPALRSLTEPIKRDDVVLSHWIDDAGKLRTSIRDVRAQGNYYLTARQRELQSTDAQSGTYAGLLPIELDGAIQQVTWAIDASGRATTRASRNREELVITPSYKERRFYERLADAQKRRDVSDRATAERLRANRGR